MLLKKSYAAFKSQSLIHTNKAATPLIVKSSFYLVLSVLKKLFLQGNIWEL